MEYLYRTSYPVLDIARYVINICNSKNITMSNLKLQKVLYFIQGNFYKNKGKECFAEDIHAWDYGPVVPEVYREFKGFGSNGIPSIKKVYKFNKTRSTFEIGDFNDDFLKVEDKEIIDKVVKMCAEYNANYLVSLTHQQVPWKDSYRRGCDNIIEKKLIKEFFVNG